ncbi:D-alanyl-D-alanine carboxypeptidase/D-alanyl-D-alanine-endopeptidase [gut metagenome]|uniref:D-alanyl-D-alanine carboxypeptidase/D-alanyl-D-alanine-endopeptidase n=1 Tax=gut metagenome TaxID=749906 RepID=J9GLE2_9ZZZZ
MKKIVLCVCLGLHLFSLAAQSGKQDISFVQQLNQLLYKELPKGSQVGISVYDLTADSTLYTYQADKLSHPASTMKLLTTITALAQKGANEPFRTEIWTKGVIRQDTLYGDLYVVGGFDPEFNEEMLDTLVRRVSEADFSVIKGQVYGDVSMKDSLYWGSGWLWDDNPSSFQPYLSPLMLCKGCVKVTAIPGNPGEPAELQCVPVSTYYQVENHTVSKSQKAGRFRVTRNWLENGNRIFVSGSVERKRSESVNLYASQDYFMHTLIERLQAADILLEDTTGVFYSFKEFRPDSISIRLAVCETPVAAVVKEIMKESDNLNAEAMLCRLGAQTTGEKYLSAEAGLSAVRALIRKLGYCPDDYNLADGCGLSNYNFISPELLVAFLRYAYSRTDVFQQLYKALPIGGIDGTLQYRMRSGTPSFRNVHAKTGSFTGINCLSGYLRTSAGHQVAFAIMNQNVLSGREARKFQDAVCDILIRCF